MYMGSASGQPGSPVLQQHRSESERTLGTLGEVRGVGEGVSGGVVVVVEVYLAVDLP